MYIAKYIKFLYGSTVIKADQYSWLGFQAKMCLEKVRYEKRNISNSAAHRGMDDSFTILINKWQYTNLGFEISPENILVLNNFLEQQFKEALFVYCQSHTKQDGFYRGHNKAIEDFAKMVGISIEEDITFEAMKKMEYRHRLQKEERKKEITAQLQIF